MLSYQNSSEAKYQLINASTLFELVDKSLFGTLIIAENEEDYKFFINKYGDNVDFREYIYSSNRNNYTKIILAPDFRDDLLSLGLYEKVIFLKAPFTDNVISYINSRTKASVYVLNRKSLADNVSLTRDIFAKYYEGIKKVDGVDFTNFFTCFRRVKSTMPDINVQQMALCVAVFEELGILKVSRNPYKLTFLPSVKVDLASSNICKNLSK
jgi:hypothetical protein